MNRRQFLFVTGAAGVAPLRTTAPQTRAANAAATADRDLWIDVMRKLADPVLNNLANGTLKARMPVEQAAGADRKPVTHLEALGRLIAGLAPWIELPADASPEGQLRATYADLARRAIGRAVDPASPDFMNFAKGGQPLVDAAFLAQGILRAPNSLRESLDPATVKHLIAALESTRAISPGFNNWLLFSATVEAGLAKLGAWIPSAMPRGARPLDYLEALQNAHRALIIHGNYLTTEEIEFSGARREQMSVVFCPRTHSYFSHDPYPLAQMLRGGVRVAVGTDSRASNPDLNLLSELRFVATHHPQVPPDKIVEMGTQAAAHALGIEANFGSITVGRRAQFVAFPIMERRRDPCEQVLRNEIPPLPWPPIQAPSS